MGVHLDPESFTRVVQADIHVGQDHPAGPRFLAFFGGGNGSNDPDHIDLFAVDSSNFLFRNDPCDTKGNHIEDRGLS